MDKTGLLCGWRIPVLVFPDIAYELFDRVIRSLDFSVVAFFMIERSGLRIRCFFGSCEEAKEPLSLWLMIS
jgi:hypothetical protein